jgi:hypothetical protein
VGSNELEIRPPDFFVEFQIGRAASATVLCVFVKDCRSRKASNSRRARGGENFAPRSRG